ncbi:MAG: LacI family transcriptional regulator [Betaproteobacteria bacterium]|nr:LacI family transcriptional regulator [Betaproteobacteria bacterium]
MKKRATIKDVARAAGVSVVTVSRVANTPELVQSETRERVRAVMREMGYSANIAARAMRTRTTRSIGFLTPDLASPINAAVAQAAEQALAAAGYAMLLTGSDHTVEREIAALDVLRTRSVDGLMLYLSSEEDIGLQQVITQMEIPVVLLDRALPVKADLVWSDHAGPMSEAVRYLHSLGHQNIALIQYDFEVRPDLERRRSFHEAVAFLGTGFRARAGSRARLDAGGEFPAGLDRG